MSNQFYVYILYAIESDRYYIGQTQDLEKRLTRHNKGYVKSTKSYIPWKIIWSIQTGSRSKSIKMEARIKSWKSTEMIGRLLRNEFDAKNW